MAITEKTKKEVKDLIVNTMNILDETGDNGKFYSDFFDRLSLKEFQQWLKDFSEDETKYVILQAEAFNKKKEPSLQKIKKAADYLNIQLDEYVYLPYENPNGEPVRTPYRIPVGYLHIKRMQQMLTKKNSFPLNMNSRNMKTNQVVNDSKSSRISDSESFIFMSAGLKYALKEFLGPRADDNIAKMDMNKAIAEKGYVKLSELRNDVSNKQAINTVDTYLLGAGIISDLITTGYGLQNTVARKGVRDTPGSKYTND